MVKVHKIVQMYRGGAVASKARQNAERERG